MTEYHEPVEELSAQARDFHRALKSLIEELEAVDWYHQRVEVSKDKALRDIMAHNRDEEMEHACMTLEWLRRTMPGWDEMLHTYLFTTGDITELEEHSAEEEGSSGSISTSGSLGLGSLKK